MDSQELMLTEPLQDVPFYLTHAILTLMKILHLFIHHSKEVMKYLGKNWWWHLHMKSVIWYIDTPRVTKRGITQENRCFQQLLAIYGYFVSLGDHGGIFVPNKQLGMNDVHKSNFCHQHGIMSYYNFNQKQPKRLSKCSLSDFKNWYTLHGQFCRDIDICVNGCEKSCTGKAWFSEL